jgi:hypothetical protein
MGKSLIGQAVSNFQIQIQETVACCAAPCTITSSPTTQILGEKEASNHFVALLLSSDSLIRYSSIESAPHRGWDFFYRGFSILRFQEERWQALTPDMG